MGTVKANLAEIRDMIFVVLEENRRPMTETALAEAVNSRLANRFPPDMLVRTFLKTDPDLFGQTRDGLWGLREWEPRVKYGAVDVIRVTSEEKPLPQPGFFSNSSARPEPYPHDMHTVLMDLLGRLTPDTDDQLLLNEISSFELEQATYRPGQLVTRRSGEASDANTLVAQPLHEKTSHGTWRYPPVMETSFYVRPTDGEHFSLDLELIYGLGTLFEYRDEKVEGNRGAVLRARSNSNLAVPADFSKVYLNARRSFKFGHKRKNLISSPV